MSPEHIDLDMALMRDFNAGKGSAFEAIYNKYFTTIYRFCLSLIDSTEDAEDITQETFVKLFQMKGTMHTAPNIRAFLYITSRNACMDYFRQEKKKAQANQALLKGLYPANYELVNDELDGMYFETVKQAISKLHQREKEVLEKLYIEDLDHRTAAKQMDIKLEALYVLRSRAVSHLKRIIFNQHTQETVFFFMLFYSLSKIISPLQNFF